MASKWLHVKARAAGRGAVSGPEVHRQTGPLMDLSDMTQESGGPVPQAEGARTGRLSNDTEFDPVKDGFIVNGSGMGSSLPK
jgi:hypothetical protein